jgi:4-oxalocrotonate tautomerase|tara:strand:+ start:202 stop:462 length:261 start_codon:yes stop_codon:yes gene_type:complete
MLSVLGVQLNLAKKRGNTMPYVNIKITDEGVTNEQKQALIKGTTQLLVDVLNKNPATTFVVIDEISMDNWGIGYDQVTKLRQGADT